MDQLQKHIIIASPYLSSPRGNSVTAKRIGQGLEELGHRISYVAYSEHPEASTKKLLTAMEQGQWILVLHAYRYGVYAEQAGLPAYSKTIVVMTGTDHNHDLFDPERKGIVTRQLEQAQAIVLFHSLGYEQVIEALPEVQGKVHVIPQGLILPEKGLEAPMNPSLERLLEDKAEHDAFVFLLPAGVRHVKNVFGAVTMLAALAEELPRLRLWLVGPLLEPELQPDLARYAARYPWFKYIGELPFEQMDRLYREADVVINTSLSEGQASSLLEAMAYGKPLLVHDIPGNRATVGADERWGWLYRTPEDFAQKAKRIVEHPELGRELGQKAQGWVLQQHDPIREAQAYLSLME